jgi:GT2 family glycosyltransferase/glycosyltransferase involved in cell wall biosynthesis
MTSKPAIPGFEPGAALGSAAAALATGREALAAGDAAGAVRYLERACRLAPRDAAARFLLASALSGMDAARAADMLRALTAAHPRFWAAKTALAALCAQAGDNDAAMLLDDVLRHAAPPADAAFARLADRVARGAGRPGWIGLDSAGVARLRCFEPGAHFALDGGPIWARQRAGREVVATMRLAGAWRGGRLLTAAVGERHFLGSALDVRAHIQAEGFVDMAPDGAVFGWAWLPGDPDVPAPLTLRAGTAAALAVMADDAGFVPEDGDGVARPRGFRVPAGQVPASGTLYMCGPDGADMFGSPIARASVAGPARKLPRRAPVDIIIPVFRGAPDFQACLASARRGVGARARMTVVDDASPDPALRDVLESLHGVVVLRHARNTGFPGAANTGLRQALEAGRDAVLLNPDTLLPRGWLKHLADAAYAAPDIGTVTPMTNDGSIVSYPAMDAPADMPGQAWVDRQHALFQAANAGELVELPTAVGFCMYIRHDCLAETGLFREDVFSQGYGEENDFCRRAAGLGWRHVADTGTFVAHAGGRSFGGAKAALLARNLRVLNRLHPGYDALIAAFLEADPLAAARRRIDVARWRAGACAARAVVLVSHRMGGGVARHVRARAEMLRGQGFRPVIVQPVEGGGCGVSDGADDGFPNLRFDVSGLADFLRPDRPRWVELHHLVGHAPEIAGLAAVLKIPFDVVVHDYASVCPRISLVAGARTYCGEPTEVADCEACVADNGSRLQEEIGVAALRARSAALAAAARRVTVPTQDTANRLLRYIRPRSIEVRGWEEVAPGDVAPPASVRGRALHVCIVGAIGEEKGFFVLLGCARDAARRELPLRFTVVGHTMDDSRLMETGRVFVTGEYEEAEAERLIRAQQADIGLLPSVWPETWCYALSALWRAGLFTVAFDIGAQAERIKHAGIGKLLPLGLPPARVNDAMLRLLGGA